MATQIVPHPKLKADTAIHVGAWILQLGLASFIGFVGWKKVTGDPLMVQTFGAIGFGQWLRSLTGTLELIGAIGLLIPRISAYAAILIAVVMTGAVATHLFLLGGSPVLPLFLGVVALFIAWFRLQVSR